MGREAGPGKKAALWGSAWAAYTASAEKAVEMEEPVRVEGMVYSIQKATCSGWVGRDCGAHERSQRSRENVACLGLATFGNSTGSWGHKVGVSQV